MSFEDKCSSVVSELRFCHSERSEESFAKNFQTEVKLFPLLSDTMNR